MSSFNPLERAIARVLSKAPFLKAFAKLVYSRLVFISHRKPYRHQTVSRLNLFGRDRESFFGYYDKSPANKEGMVLCHLSNIHTCNLPDENNSIDVALFSPNQSAAVWSASTFAYNWQQGARLHWLDSSKFIYNDFDDTEKKYISKVISSQTLMEVKSFDYPVQDSFGTDYFLSLNYRRLMALRPDYGYRNLTIMSDDELKTCDNDGIWRVDYQTGETDLLVSLANMCEVSPKPEFEHALHKVNHVMISPDGAQFIVLHRYFIGLRRFDRLMLADSKSGALKLLSDYGMVSHCVWVDGKTILAYMRGPANKDAYWLVDVESGIFKHFSSLDGLGDGHPHVHGDWFVADTYPDKSRMQSLNLVNWKTGELKKLGEYFHGFEYGGESRCDLHPRFSPDGKKVYFDSVFSGKRQLYELELED